MCGSGGGGGACASVRVCVRVGGWGEGSRGVSARIVLASDWKSVVFLAF